MATSIQRGKMILYRSALYFSSRRQISNLKSEIVPILSSSFHIQHRNRFWYSSTTAATKDQSLGTEEKPPTESLQNDRNESGLSQKEKELVEENKKLLETVENLNDKYKRALADNENIRNRMRREMADAKQFGIQGFVKDLLEVADVLGKATESVPKEALNQGNVHLKSLYEGLQMTEAQLVSLFKRHGVTQINPIGEKFNPNQHEALFEVEDASKQAGTVGVVTKVGYQLHERVVRPAMVGVVKAKS